MGPKQQGRQVKKQAGKQQAAKQQQGKQLGRQKGKQQQQQRKPALGAKGAVAKSTGGRKKPSKPIQGLGGVLGEQLIEEATADLRERGIVVRSKSAPRKAAQESEQAMMEDGSRAEAAAVATAAAPAATPVQPLVDPVELLAGWSMK